MKLLSTAFLLPLLSATGQEKEIEPVKEHVVLVEKFMEAVQIKDEKEREKALVAIVHASLKSPEENSNELHSDIKEYRLVEFVKRLEQKWWVLPPKIRKATTTGKERTISWFKSRGTYLTWTYYLEPGEGNPGSKFGGRITLCIASENGKPKDGAKLEVCNFQY